MTQFAVQSIHPLRVKTVHLSSARLVSICCTSHFCLNNIITKDVMTTLAALSKVNSRQQHKLITCLFLTRVLSHICTFIRSETQVCLISPNVIILYFYDVVFLPLLSHTKSLIISPNALSSLLSNFISRSLSNFHHLQKQPKQTYFILESVLFNFMVR